VFQSTGNMSECWCHTEEHWLDGCGKSRTVATVEERCGGNGKFVWGMHVTC